MCFVLVAGGSHVAVDPNQPESQSHSAEALASEERAALFAVECGGNAEPRARVERLLAAPAAGAALKWLRGNRALASRGLKPIAAGKSALASAATEVLGKLRT